MASTTAGAVSATADGKGLNATCPVVSVWTPSVGVVACVLQAPAYVTLASKVDNCDQGNWTDFSSYAKKTQHM